MLSKRILTNITDNKLTEDTYFNEEIEMVLALSNSTSPE